MKICPNCQAQHEDTMAFCLQCGTALVEAPEQPAAQAEAQAQYEAQPQYEAAYAAQAPYTQYAAPVNPDDHTAEFDAEDIAQNKLFAMLPYLFGIIGIIAAKLCAKDSAYVQFHVKQALRLAIAGILLTLITALLWWTIVIAVAGGVCLCIIAVLEIIAFVQVCKGQAKEVAIIKNIKFLQ